MSDFKLSEYQEDIFDFIKFGYGNAVVTAVAGAGKSFTIVKAIDYIKPEKRVLFLAFNNGIVEELKTKINRKNTDIKTLHSLGFSILRNNFKDKKIEIYEHKYRDKMVNLQDTGKFEQVNDKKIIKNILKLCDLGRLFLTKTKVDLKTLAEKYSIDILDNEIEFATELIEWGKNSLNETNYIDYVDMLYLPNVLNVKIFKYDFIFIDEAQDLSISQMSLFLKCFKQGGRFISVGDEKQCINSFAGSDIESFNKLKKLPNTIQLPLSICYRCPKNVIAIAKKYVPEIESSDTAINGFINYKSEIKDLKDGDLVICRNTMPLVKLYAELINDNIKCYLKGIDVGLNLIDLIKEYDIEDVNELIKELDKDEIEISNDDNIESSEFAEKIQCIKIISKNINTKTELIEKIIAIFSDENKDGICLSTIHKAKGLEADNVYILNKHLIPSKLAKKEWELKQERNLEYVAHTRAKKILGFLLI